MRCSILAVMLCDQPVSGLPDGLHAGRHIYRGNEDIDFRLADGVPIELTTCAPGTAACSDLESPF